MWKSWPRKVFSCWFHTTRFLIYLLLPHAIKNKCVHACFNSASLKNNVKNLRKKERFWIHCIFGPWCYRAAGEQKSAADVQNFKTELYWRPPQKQANGFNILPCSRFSTQNYCAMYNNTCLTTIEKRSYKMYVLLTHSDIVHKIKENFCLSVLHTGLLSVLRFQDSDLRAAISKTARPW